MDSLPLTTRTSGKCISGIQFILHPFHRHASRPRLISFTTRKPGKTLVFASKDDPEYDEWDKMELKFGLMIDEDPEETKAKIKARKLYPDISYIEYEKLMKQNKKGKKGGTAELVYDLGEERKARMSKEGLNLARPIPKKGTEFEENVKQIQKREMEELLEEAFKARQPTASVERLNLVRPVPKRGTKFEEPVKPIKTNKRSHVQPVVEAIQERTSSVPNVILRKPQSFAEEDDGNGESSRFGMKPNLSLRMGKEKQKETFSDMTLLRKPELVISIDDSGNPDSDDGRGDDIEEKSTCDATLLEKPELMIQNMSEGAQESTSSNDVNESQEANETDPELGMGSTADLQADMWPTGTSVTADEVSGSSNLMSTDMMLKGRPKRLDLSTETSNQKRLEEPIRMTPESSENQLEIENFSTSPNTEGEDDDWDRAESLAETGKREEVELISSSARGFAVSFGSLTGFLPYRNLPARWKFLAFESWLRKNGLDPGNYRQNLGIIGKYDVNSTKNSSVPGLGSDNKNKPDTALLPDLELEDLLMKYDQEKLTFLSNFVGQRISVGVVLADRENRRLIVTQKPREKEEMVARKKRLMSQLSVGDVVKCCITKIAYFGIFVEVEGIPALIHQTEVSWDATLDPESCFKVGQIVEAKVHQLDFSLQRIFLSLKEITPDPLLGALDAVIGDRDPLDGELEAAVLDTEWAEVESLIKELQQYDGIQSVSRGRYFLSPGLAPAFQVYMASTFQNQYKLLARAGNKVQELIVQTSLGKDEVKDAITTCTNRVE